MSTGNILYLLMSVGTFVGFSLALAYASWQQPHPGPALISEHENNGDDLEHLHA